MPHLPEDDDDRPPPPRPKAGEEEPKKGVPPVPLAGFFCSGEIAPVGARGVSASDGEGSGSCRTYLHGFTSVFAVIYDKSPPQS